MKQAMTKVNVVLFCLLLAVFFYIGVLCPKDSQAEKNENRELAKFPRLTAETLFSGTFSLDFENYLADNVGMRSRFMKAANMVESIKGIKTEAGRLVTANKDLGTGNQGDNHLLILQDRVMEVYKQNKETEEKYSRMLNTYREKLPSTTRLITMLIPTQIEFYENDCKDSQKETIDAIYNAVSKDIVTVNAYDVLQEKKEEYIYFRTDHHWTQRGAFYGYTAFCDALGYPVPSLSDYEEKSYPGFLGYLYNQAKDTSLKKHADTIYTYQKGENLTVLASAMEEGNKVTYNAKLYHEPAPLSTPNYGIFMGGDHPFAEIVNDKGNGKTLLVIKDSYANTLLPFLAGTYSRVLVVDPRNYYSTISELCRTYTIDDCLCINYVFTTTFADFIDRMIAII